MALVQRNAATAEGSGHEIALLDADGCYLAFANRDRRLLAAGAAAPIGTAFIATWPESVRAFAEQALRQAMSGDTSSIDAETRDPDGRPVAWHVVLSPLVSAENVDGRVVVVASDVTQRKQAEQALRESETRLQTIVDSIQAGVLLIDAETHTIVEANPAALAMIGASREAVLGRICHEFVCPAEIGRCPVTDLVQAVDNSERSLVTSTGEQTAILKTVVPITLHGRKHLLESFIDITHRKQVEAQLAAHRAQLEDMVKERTEQLLQAERQMLQTEKLASVGRLAAGVAHEINTPIQYVGDNLHALSESFADLCRLLGEYRHLGDLIDSAQSPTEAIERVRVTEQEIDLPFILDDAPKAIVQGLEGVKRVASIVRAMKDFSHIKSGTAMSVDINGCLESTLTVARNEYKYVADVEKHFDSLPGVECYPSELNQVFLNLLVNAAHAIQDTGRRGKITITTRAMDKTVEIAIADTGTGIPEEIRGKIYDLFFTTKEVGRGTGQGLYLAYQTVVGKHGGTLHCDSEVGKGTTFRITLPTRLPEQQNDAESGHATCSQSSDGAPGEQG